MRSRGPTSSGRSRRRRSRSDEANVFPVRLAPEDWTSGDIVWLLDLIAADSQQATSVLANFRKVAGERSVKIAPLVARLIDPEVAAKLRGAKLEEEAAELSKADAQGTA